MRRPVQGSLGVTGAVQSQPAREGGSLPTKANPIRKAPGVVARLGWARTVWVQGFGAPLEGPVLLDLFSFSSVCFIQHLFVTLPALPGVALMRRLSPRRALERTDHRLLPVPLCGHLPPSSAAVNLPLHAFGVHVVWYAVPLPGTFRPRRPSQHRTQCPAAMSRFALPWVTHGAVCCCTRSPALAGVRLFSCNRSGGCVLTPMVVSMCISLIS